ncbi:alpha/beta hydrolase family protein [Bombilactobacillus thymidiniphilus]|uniref:Lipase (Class 3) n=1 Tax=Bombilactobacillus thymidiniphilus TaxID=2923363 RepID=A0ABY4PES4_9LACO|nr:hypothetical protein [Bombilactobacillus thymidiniphilus]UQS84245.1 hypothetical protein MOO47_03600 [Bombilactobacillus thymidiniphilus]
MAIKMLDWSQLNSNQMHDFVLKEYKDNLKIGDPVYIGDDIAGFVVAKPGNKKTGEQALIISNSPKGTPADDIKHIAVMYQGSSSPVTEDGLIDWYFNDLQMVKNMIDPQVNAPKPMDMTSTEIPSLDMQINPQRYKNKMPGQLTSSAQTLRDAFRDYKNADVTVLGHSLGSSDGQVALASLSDENLKRLAGAYLFEGPNIFTLLNKKQKAVALKLPKYHVLNFVDLNDVVTVGYGADIPTVGAVKYTDTNFVDDIVKQHMQYPKDGVLKTLPNGELKLTSYAKARAAAKKNHPYGSIITKHFKGLTKKFVGKNVSAGASSKIMLDDTELNDLATKMNSHINEDMQAIVADCQRYIAESEQDWHTVFQGAHEIAPHLEHDEIMGLLAQVGCTQNNFVQQPNAVYSQHIQKAQTLMTDFSNTAKHLRQSGTILDEADDNTGELFD